MDRIFQDLQDIGFYCESDNRHGPYLLLQYGHDRHPWRSDSGNAGFAGAKTGAVAKARVPEFVAKAAPTTMNVFPL